MAGKLKFVDDTPVFSKPIVRAPGGDLFFTSTPKGPNKMFYKIVAKNQRVQASNDHQL